MRSKGHCSFLQIGKVISTALNSSGIEASGSKMIFVSNAVSAIGTQTIAGRRLQRRTRQVLAIIERMLTDRDATRDNVAKISPALRR